MSKKKLTSNNDPRLLELVMEVNTLRDEIVILKQHSLALNQVTWTLAEGLGLVEEGQTELEIIPMDLARLAIKRANEA